ncbi:MAG: hypothetical protein Rubg2KO_33830 [Rubricoccaceae bacterium]
MRRSYALNVYRAMRLLLCLALIAACANPPADSDEPPSEAIGSTIIVGTVASVDLAPMAYDGDAEIVVATSSNDDVVVRVPARSNQCRAEGLGLISELQSGDAVEVIGEWLDDEAVMPCRGMGHRILRTEIQTDQTVRGVFESGFETSAFSPCDQPDEQWWMSVTDPDFNEQFEAIRLKQGGGGGRGLRLFIEATLVGDLEAGGGPYGHLGMYAKRFTVTDTQEMVFLAANPDSTVSCR